jgi:hypothetical protein
MEFKKIWECSQESEIEDEEIGRTPIGRGTRKLGANKGATE